MSKNAEQAGLIAYPRTDDAWGDEWQKRVGFVEGYNQAQQDFIEKAAEFLYNYNQKQVLKHGARATLGCGEYTINVDEFRKHFK